MTVLPSIVCKLISGIIAGSQLSDTALAIASIFLNTSSLPKPTTSLVLSAIPKIIFPPVPFANATTDFIYLMLFSGRFSLNSTFFDSPARISSRVIIAPRSHSTFTLSFSSIFSIIHKSFSRKSNHFLFLHLHKKILHILYFYIRCLTQQL